MTSKEFFRRIESYVPLDSAASMFLVLPDLGHVYRCTLHNMDSKREFFVRLPQHAFGFEDLTNLFDSCVSLYFDKFTRSDFEIQLRYFKSFYNRCSTYQKEVIRSSHRLVSLLAFYDSSK